LALGRLLRRYLAYSNERFNQRLSIFVVRKFATLSFDRFSVVVNIASGYGRLIYFFEYLKNEKIDDDKETSFKIYFNDFYFERDLILKNMQKMFESIGPFIALLKDENDFTYLIVEQDDSQGMRFKELPILSKDKFDFGRYDILSEVKLKLPSSNLVIITPR